MFNKEKCNPWQCGNKVGLFLSILFVICFIWFFIRPVEQDLHIRLLKLSFFGFKDMGFLSFVLGLVQSYIWGYIAVGIWQIAGGCRNIGRR